jgi:hypothetical protein
MIPHSLRLPVFPSGRALRSIYNHLLSFPNVVGCYIGRKKVGGVETHQPAVVCCVSAKPPPDQLHPGVLLPPGVSWMIGSRSFRSAFTDVQVVTASGFHALAGAGDWLNAVQSPSSGSFRMTGATTGPLLEHPRYGLLLSTAGHAMGLPFGTDRTFGLMDGFRVLLQNGPGADQGRAFEALTLRVSFTRRRDCALLVPVNVASQKSYRDEFMLGSTFAPDHFAIGTTLYALTVRGYLPLRYHGAESTVTIEGVAYEKLHLAEMGPNRLFEGDSGCTLIDNLGRVWGMHLGFIVKEGVFYSVFRASTDELAFTPSGIS